MTVSVVLNGNSYSDADYPTDPGGFGNSGVRKNLFPMLQDLLVTVSAAATAAATASAAALTAVNAPGTTTTSTTSNSITGAVGTDKTFTVASGKTIVPGMRYQVARTSAPATQSMSGYVKTYSGTTLVITIDTIVGTGGPFTDWTLSLAAASGGIPSTRLVSAGGLVTGGGDLSADRTLTVTGAVAADVRAGTSTSVVTTPGGIAAGLAFVALTDAATIACDFAAFKNGTVTINANRTLGNPTNVKPGYDTGTIEVIIGAAGNWDLAFASNWVREGGAPDMPTGAGQACYIHYIAITTTKIVYSISKNPTN